MCRDIKLIISEWHPPPGGGKSSVWIIPASMTRLSFFLMVVKRKERNLMVTRHDLSGSLKFNVGITLPILH
jgi:hypothetical protein